MQSGGGRLAEVLTAATKGTCMGGGTPTVANRVRKKKTVEEEGGGEVERVDCGDAGQWLCY